MLSGLSENMSWEQSRVVRGQIPKRRLLGKKRMRKRETAAILQGTQGSPKHASESRPEDIQGLCLDSKRIKKRNVCLA